jgi:hypothetical protein
MTLFKQIEQYLKGFMPQMKFRPLAANTALPRVNLNVVNTINLFACSAHRCFIARVSKIPEKFQISYRILTAFFEIERVVHCS